MTDDATLILRGRYATYASERRALMKTLQGRMQDVQNCAHIVLRTQSGSLAADALLDAENHIKAARSCFARIAELNDAMDELRESAWGTKTGGEDGE